MSPGEVWTPKDNRAAVLAYKEMLAREFGGVWYVKVDVYRRLHAGTLANHSIKSIERRMRNISHVLDQVGLPWIKGLKPLSHVGTEVAREVKQLLIEDLKPQWSDLAGGPKPTTTTADDG